MTIQQTITTLFSFSFFLTFPQAQMQSLFTSKALWWNAEGSWSQAHWKLAELSLCRRAVMGTTLGLFVGSVLWCPCGRRKQKVRVSLFQTRPLILKYNIEYVVLVCHRQIWEQYSLLPIDLSLYISSKKLSYAKLLAKACCWESSFAFHLSRWTGTCSNG